MKPTRTFPCDLSDQQWASIKQFVPEPRSGGRRRTTNMRKVLDALFYINRTGCAWRYLPKQFPKWQTVYDYFSQWSKSQLWHVICEHMAELVRVEQGLDIAPRTVIFDSQSVKAHYGEHRGYDGFKKVRGRKRHIMIDTLGLIHNVRVRSANSSDSFEGLRNLYDQHQLLSQRPLQVIYADGGYKTKVFLNYIYDVFNITPTLNISTMFKDRQRDQRTLINSNLSPKRWIVERTFAWLGNFRRLTADFEKRTLHSEAMIYIAMIQIELKRLVPE